MRTIEKMSARAARAELQAWYLEHLRPRLEDAVALGNVERGEMLALDFQLALGPAGEIFREAGALAEKRRPEIVAAMRSRLSGYQRDGKVFMPSGSWTITARKPAS